MFAMETPNSIVYLKAYASKVYYDSRPASAFSFLLFIVLKIFLLKRRNKLDQIGSS